MSEPNPVDKLNTPTFNERTPPLHDARLLFFSSDRTGGSGGLDLYVSWRTDRHDDGAWAVRFISSSDSLQLGGRRTAYVKDERRDKLCLLSTAARAHIFAQVLDPAGLRRDTNGTKNRHPGVFAPLRPSPFPN